LPKTWSNPKIKEVFTINPKNKVLDNINVGFVPMVYIDDGYSGTFKYEKRKWSDIKAGFTHFADGDIAVAKISPCLENRKSMILEKLPNGIGAGTTELYIFRSLKINPKYALYFFKSNSFIQQCIGTFNGVVGQQRVARRIIEEINFPLPPLSEQQRIVTKIEELFSILNIIETELTM
jgi:type I restriction enzyme stySJI specificity protein